MVKKIRGVALEENLNNTMGLEFYNLSHRFGYQSPNWPYFEDVKIERIHYMAKSGVLSQRITTSMHNTTHIDAPAHVIQGTPFIDEVPLPHFFGSGIVVSIPKKKWEQITYDDLEKAAGKIVRPRDVVAGFFDGARLVAPGLVRVSDWRPDSPEDALPTILWGGVAVKR